MNKNVQVLQFGTSDPVPVALFPVMTSASTPSGYSTDASTYIGGYEPYKAVTGSLVDYWAITGAVGWLRQSIPTLKVPRYYTVQCDNVITDGAIKNWTFEASVNGTTWDVLDTRVNVSNWASVPILKCMLSKKYTKYNQFRVNVTANNGRVNTAILEFQVYGF